MKKITESKIIDAVSQLCIDANRHLRPDIIAGLKKAYQEESDPQAKNLFQQLLENAKIAKNEKIALCQDTGVPVVFVAIGQGVNVTGIDFNSAVNKGVERGYRRGFLRNSIIRDPLLRVNASRYTPCVVHYNFGKHRGLKLTVLPKGFGSENKTRLAMFNPTDSVAEIKKFIVDSVRQAGADACPPYILGIGIGGTADYAALLSKEALLRPIAKHNPLKHVAKMEAELLEEINALNIGPMGLGGKTTVLGVNVLTYPTHIAGLPVCINISCHVLRSASVVIQ